MKERDLEDTHRHRQTTQERVDHLQHQLEAEMRQLAAVRTELHTVNITLLLPVVQLRRIPERVIEPAGGGHAAASRQPPPSCTW